MAKAGIPSASMLNQRETYNEDIQTILQPDAGAASGASRTTRAR